jgi:DNA polymerase III sliding clamp (beta) subunit (PCNA family)
MLVSSIILEGKEEYARMKKDELLKILDLVLPAVVHREIFEYATKLCFRAKTVTGFNYNVSIGVKLDTDFEGLLPAEEFAKILRSLKKDRIKFAYEGGDLIVNANKGRSIKHGTLVYRKVGDDPSIRLGSK